MRTKQKYDKETLSQLDEIHLAILSNNEVNKAHEIVPMLFFANLGMALIPGLFMKLLCFVIALGWAIYGAVVYVRLDRIGKELEKNTKSGLGISKRKEVRNERRTTTYQRRFRKREK